MQGIEAAKSDLNVFEAMKQGDQVLKDLKSQVTAEQWEELYDDHLDQVAQEEKEREMFGQVLDADELDAELAQLVAESEVAIPDAGTSKLPAIKKTVQKEAAQEESSEPKRQLVAA